MEAAGIADRCDVTRARSLLIGVSGTKLAAFLARPRAKSPSALSAARSSLPAERPLIASRGNVDRFVRDVDNLRDDVARLEKRLANLPHGQGAKPAA